MEDKNNKGDGSPGKYFRAVAAWVEDADKIDDLEDIPLYGHLKVNPATTKEGNSTSKRELEDRTQKIPKEKAADEVGDNINVNEMLVNIMEALKEEDGGKKQEKKKTYAPLERVKRNDPELEKPAFVRVNQENSEKEETNRTNKVKNLHDLKIEDFEKTSGTLPKLDSGTFRKTGENVLMNPSSTTNQNYNPFTDKFNMSEIKIDDDNLRATGDIALLKPTDRLFSPQNQNLNPFAKSLYPSAQINDNFVASGEGSDDKKKAMGNRKHFESLIQSTINDLSAIHGDGIIRDNLDSRGSFIPGVTLLNTGNHNPQDKVLTPGIQIIGSPEKTGRNGNDDESPELRIQDNAGSLDDIDKNERAQGKSVYPSERNLTRRRRSKFDPSQKDIPKDYNWIHDLREYTKSQNKDIETMNRIRAKSKDSIEPNNITHDDDEDANNTNNPKIGENKRYIPEYNWYQDLRGNKYDKSKDVGSMNRIRAKSKDSIDQIDMTDDGDTTNDPNGKESKKNRRAQVLDLLARLAVDKNSMPTCTREGCNHENHDHDAANQRGKSRGKSRGRNDTTRRGLGDEGNATTKYTAGLDTQEDGSINPSTKFERNQQDKNKPFDPNGTETLDEHFKWLQNREENIRRGIDGDDINGTHKYRTPGNIIDETRDTAYQKENRKESQDITGLLGNINVGTQLTLDKEHAKDQKLRDLMGNQLNDNIDNKIYPLSKKITGETDIRFEEEESPFFVTFKKRKFNEEESVLLDHNEDVDLSMSFEQAKSVKSESRIEWEEVDEPISNTMIHLFVGMKKRVSRMEYLIQEVRKPDYTLDTFFERNFKFLKGKLQVTKNFFFIFTILTAVMLYFIFDTMDAKSLSRVKNDEEKLTVAKLMIPAAILFTYYGMGLLYLPVKWLKYVVLAQVIPCGIILAVDLGNTFIGEKMFPDARVYVCSFIVGTNVFWVATKYLRKDILTNYSWAWSIFFLFSWCVLLPTATIAYAVYVTVVSRRFNYNWAHELTLHIGIPTMMLLCLTWVYYHFKFFVPATKKKVAKANSEDPAKAQVQPEVVSKQAEEKIMEQFAEISEDEEEKEDEPAKPLKLRIYINVKTLLKRVSRTAIIISSFSLGGSLIFIEGLLLIYLSTITQNTSVPSNAAFYFAIMLYFFIPTAVLFGIPIIATNKNHASKMFWIPVVAILFPLFITMPVSNYLIDESYDTTPMGTFFALAPSIVTGFWITLSYIGQRKKKIKFSMISYLFIFFVIPLVVLQPLINTDGFAAEAVAQGFSAFFLAVGIIILVIALAYLISRALLIKEIKKKDRLNTDNYKLINIFKTDLEPFGYWSNSLGFIVNFTISLFTLFHAPEEAPTGLKGLALGLSFCFIIFFIYNNLGLHLHIINNPEIFKYGIRSLSAAIIQSVRNNELYDEIQKTINANDKIKGYTRLFTLGAAIISAIIALAFSASNDFILNMFASIAVGVVVIQIIFEIYGGIKEKYPNLAKAIIPMLFTYLWFVHALAFPSILHLTRVFYIDDEETRKRVQVQLIVLVFVLTVSFIAIISNIIFKGIELEQKIKYILAYIRKQLENIAVKSDYFVLQRIFDGWMENGEKKLRKMLVNRGKPAFWWPIPATNPNTKYSKVLLDWDAYNYMKLRLKKRLEGGDEEGINTNKRIKKRRGWLSKLCCCLGFCLPFLKDKRERGKLDEELNEEIEELLDLQMHEVPLPPKEDGDESDEDSSDDDFDPADFGDWEVESKIAENKMEIMDVKFKPLDERVLRAMMYYDSGIKFAHNDKFTVDFLKFVYRLFAVGNYKYFKKRWLDYLGYKRFMILSAITPTPEFPDYMVDLVYTLYTHNVGRGQIQRRVDYSTKKNQARKKKVKKNKKEVERDNKLKVKVFPVFEEDFEGFLTHIAKKRFPNEINDRDALFRLIRWHLFPNFLHLLPSVQKEYPHEYEYLKFLIDLYMKMDKANQAGLNPDGTQIQGDGTGNGEDADGLNGKNGKGGKDGNGENGDGTNGLNGSGLDGKGGSGLNDSNDSANRKKRRTCLQRALGCVCNTISLIYGAFKKCFSHLFKKLGEFLENFFFLKTNAQKKADKEFEEQQRKADKEERDEVNKIRQDKENQTKLGDDPDVLAEDLNKEGKFRRKRKTYPHRPSPEWPAIVETIIKALKDAENDYENKKANQKQPYFIPNVRNICSLLAKIFEVYCLTSIAFRVEVPWGWSNDFQEALAFPSGFTTAYKMKIWSSLAYSIFYCYIGLVSISFAKEGILGADKATMKAGEFPSRGFAHSQILTHFSTTLSVWIITTFLGLFSCDYYESPEILYYMPNIVCDSSLHKWFIVLASFGLLFYYPISSFLYPNLQYLNVGNDIKYDTSFVVLFNQAKLIIIAVTIFFPYKNEVLVSLFVSIAIWIGLAVVNRILKPNTVIVLNIWETALYFTGAWVNIVGVIAYFSESAALSTTILILGLLAILGITYAIHRYKKLPFSFDEPKVTQKPKNTNNIEQNPLKIDRLASIEEAEGQRDKESMTPLKAPQSMALDFSQAQIHSVE